MLDTLARLQRPGVPALTYVANGIRIGDRETPYSTVTAIDIDGYSRLSVPVGPPAPGADAISEGDPQVRGSLQVERRTRRRASGPRAGDGGRTQSPRR